MLQARETDLKPDLPSKSTTLGPVLARITGVMDKRRSTGMVQKVCQGQSKFWSPHAIFENNRYIPICNGSSSIRVGGTIDELMRVPK